MSFNNIENFESVEQCNLPTNIEIPNVEKCNNKYLSNNFKDLRHKFFVNKFENYYFADHIPSEEKKKKLCVLKALTENNLETMIDGIKLSNKRITIDKNIDHNINTLDKNKKTIDNHEHNELLREYRLKNTTKNRDWNKTIYIILIVFIVIFLIIELFLLLM